MPNHREVVIVSGPPGAGKTTVAAALASESERGVHLESDWFYSCIRVGFIGPHLSEANSQNETVMAIATDAAAGFALAGYAVFWDGVVGPWFLDRISDRLTERGIALRYLILRSDRETALQRVRDRDGTTEVVGAATMFDKFLELGEMELHVIESDDDPSLVLERCRSALSDGGFVWPCLQVKVDQ